MGILGMGSHIVECLRIAQIIERHGEMFIQRVYTEREIYFCSSKSAATQHYAEHWAAKEAVLKSLGTHWRRGIRWCDIEICHPANRGPIVVLSGGVSDLMAQKNIQKLHISLAHCRNHATANVIAEGE